MSRFFPLLVILLLPLFTSELPAQFNPSVTTTFDTLEASIPSGFTQIANFAAGEEGPASLTLDIDRGSFDFVGFSSGQLSGVMVVDVFVETPFPLPDVEGEIIAEVQVIAVSSDVMTAEAVVTQLTGNVGPGLALLGVPDPTGQVAFFVTYQDLSGDSGATMSVVDAGSLPLSGALDFDVPLTWTTPAILVQSPVGGTLTVTTTLTSSSGLIDTTVESFNLTGGIAPPPPVTNLICQSSGSDVSLSWSNPLAFSAIEIVREGSLLQSLPGYIESYIDTSPQPGSSSYQVIGYSGVLASSPPSCTVEVTIPVNSISVVSQEGHPGDSISVAVESDFELETEGFAFGVNYPQLQLHVDSVSISGTVAEGAGYFFSNIDNLEGTTTVAVLMDTGSSSIPAIPPGNSLLIATFEMSIDSAAFPGMALAVSLPIVIGSPPVEAVVIQNGGAGYAPIRSDGVVNVTSVPATDFRRGDCNSDGTVDVADAISALAILFNGRAIPSCLSPCDSNDDGTLDVADGIHLLAAIFAGGAPPPAPGPDNCGPDPTADDLNCSEPDCL